MSTLQADKIKYQSASTRSRGVAQRGRCNRVPRTHLSVAFATCVVHQLCPRYRLDVSLEACTDSSSVRMAHCGFRAAFVWLCESKTIEDHGLYHATVVSRCTSKAMSSPIAVLRDVLSVKALSKIYSRLCTLNRLSSRVQRADPGFEYICATYSRGMAHNMISNRVGACTSTRIKLVGRTVPCKHTSTEEHPKQKNGAINSHTSGLSTSTLFSDRAFSVP